MKEINILTTIEKQGYGVKEGLKTIIIELGELKERIDGLYSCIQESQEYYHNDANFYNETLERENSFVIKTLKEDIKYRKKHTTELINLENVIKSLCHMIDKNNQIIGDALVWLAQGEFSYLKSLILNINKEICGNKK